MRARRQHRYVMLFRGNRWGLPKRVELWSDGANDALELAPADQAQRTLEGWEDGDFLCQISRAERPDENEGLGMPGKSYRSSKPDSWSAPGPYQDESLRRKKHGPIRPMEEPGFISRLFRR